VDGPTQPVVIDIKQHWSQMAVPVIGAVTALAALGALLFTSEQVRIAQQGQLTDRFTRAVEQLGQAGPQKVDVRLGAIYSLERIMRDSTEDHPAVVEILAAFIRVHAPRADRRAAEPKPPIDVQTALTVLGRRKVENDIPRRYVDLSDANLAGADMWSLDFPDANLSGANLSGAFLDRGYLRGAVLTSANLRDAEVAAYLENASLENADLRGADLSGAVEMASDQVRCAFVDATTALPPQVERPMPDAPLRDPTCRSGLD
jgi:hypothetical protein